MGKRRYGNSGKKKTAWYKKKYSAMEIASKALKMAKYMKGMINCEKHYFDNTISSTPSYTGLVYPLLDNAQGDDSYNRSGNSLLLRSIYLKLNVSGNVVNSQTNIRIILFQDLENTGTAPNMADLLTSASNASSYLSALNVDHTPRYKILYDKTLTQVTANNLSTILSKYIKIYTHIKYTGPAIADYYKNMVFMGLISDRAPASNLPTINGNVRLGYYDN